MDKRIIIATIWTLIFLTKTLDALSQVWATSDSIHPNIAASYGSRQSENFHGAIDIASVDTAVLSH